MNNYLEIPNNSTDCISRQAVIDLMMQKWGENFSGDDAMQESIDAIRVMPSVTPQLTSGLEKNLQKLEKDFGELDCISRSDAIRVASGYCHPSNVAKELAKLPSVTPEPQTFKWCTDCKEYDQEKHCCHRWSKAIWDTIEEMKQETFINKPCVSGEVCEHDKQKVLEKIRDQLKSNLRGVEITLEVLVENDPLRPKMEGAKDALEDCLELIDKAEGSDKG